MNSIKTLQLAVIEATVKAREVIQKHEMAFMTAVQKAQMMAEEQNGEPEERSQVGIGAGAEQGGGREDTTGGATDTAGGGGGNPAQQ